jgi:hypothetical protein
MSELFGFSRLISALVLCLLLGGAHAYAHSWDRREQPREEPREEACVGIAEACTGALLAVSRNPELADEVAAIFLETGEKARALRLQRCDRHHVAAALGRIAGTWAEAFVRNPILADELKEVVQLCHAALSEALGRRR